MPPDTAHCLTVDADDAGARLDRWLAGQIPALSRSRLQQLIREGQVRLTGQVCTAVATTLKAHDAVEVRVPPPRATALEAQHLALDVVHEDDALIVVDKPAGLVVHPAAGNPDKTLVNALLAHCGDSLRGIGGELRPGIVHRIDKETSGLLVAAKTGQAHAALAAQFAAHSIERAYDALVWGVPSPKQGKISGHIARSTSDRKKMAVTKRGGKYAETHYRVLENFAGVAALVQCRLTTGRTHQIRVHMASLGHPLIGDPVYGRAENRFLKRLSEQARAAVKNFKRQALHARTLGFAHPTTGKPCLFERDPPADFAALAAALRGDGD
ncbi:MAG: RluA family pseudouridine synthase [Rhodospirillaceae bacterium]|nr:RluA family pseudouridine synthase [Rhodospirillaceae bacterium]